jgi:hypothetical protein
MNCPLEVKNLYVSSENRNTQLFPYGNAYTLYIDTPIKDITMVELLYASVPNTMYNLTTNLNNVIGFTPPGGGLEIMETIPNGFYSGPGLATEITNAVVNSSNITVTWLSNQGIFLFSRPVADGPFLMNIVTDELAKLLGFPGAGTYSSVNIPELNTNTRYQNKEYLLSPTLADLNTYDGVFLDIEELRSIFNECAPMGQPNYQSSKNASRSFGMIPLDVNSGCIKKFKKCTDYDAKIDYMYPIRKLDRLTIRWTDKHNNLLNFNGYEDNTFILRLHTLRQNLC